MRIAMWSGPRNLSTAMMYSFLARGDFTVMDEPFYAPYLATTGRQHPMAAEIIAAHETDPDTVARTCLAPVATPHVYMKHMPHHMLPGFPMDWARNCVNVHLIRHPARVIASYAAKHDDITLDDIGFERQMEVFDQLGGIVIDGTDVRADPERMLTRLCNAIGLPFHPAMLHWQAGPRAADGVWAAHWYGAVHRSTGFAGAEGPLPELTGELKDLCDQAMPAYEQLAQAGQKLSL
ncbi:HAD family hydrolase [uncultured Roseobacter sp.]|uniref:sulfotransferase-like domain-containing protein n=1 Tax=uncultured Roseobacter sp. TaxID=114847 RepID=UPI00260F9BDB|nr:HAD family hydrolase [uncultured Roseobacter sp.]